MRSVGPDFVLQLQLVSLTLITAGLRAIPAAMLARELRFGALATVEVAQHLVFYGVALLLAFNGGGSWGSCWP